ncbi:MAG: hypothetical protein HC828_19735 [Blastochloris sp.]|nr:hypothetical protein [Blastochloris sp.]
MAREMRAVADEFTTYLGPNHTLHNYYVITQDDDCKTQVLVVQPLLHACPLAELDYGTYKRASVRLSRCNFAT